MTDIQNLAHIVSAIAIEKSLNHQQRVYLHSRGLSQVQAEGPVAEVTGVQAAAELVERLLPAEREQVMTAVRKDVPELAAQIDASALHFDAIIALPDNIVQDAMREMDNNSLSLVLKTADEAVSARIFGLMSPRAIALLREDMQNLKEPSPLEIDGARLQLVQILRALVSGRPVPSKYPPQEETLD